MIYFNSQRNSFSTLQIVMGLVFFFSLLYIGFYITKWVLVGLSFLAPVLLIAAMVMNFATIKNFVKYLWNSIRKNPLFGLVLTLISIIAFPVTSLILFFRARSQWKKRKYVYEEAVADGSEYIEFVELPEDQAHNIDSMKNYR